MVGADVGFGRDCFFFWPSSPFFVVDTYKIPPLTALPRDVHVVTADIELLRCLSHQDTAVDDRKNLNIFSTYFYDNFTTNARFECDMLFGMSMGRQQYLSLIYVVPGVYV